MNLSQAKAECERWLAYLRRQEEKSVAVQKVATDRRAGRCDEAEARRRLRVLDSGVTVYDGAKLSEAVRCLLQTIK